MLTSKLILKVMLSMLSADNARPADIDHVHLKKVASAIEKHQSTEVPAVRLLALAYEETRFSYKGVIPVSSDGACGIYQQIPKYAQVKTTCAKLKDADHATAVAAAYLKYMRKRFRAKTATAMDQKICHYFSGNVCGDKASTAYAKRHARARAKALAIASK